MLNRSQVNYVTNEADVFQILNAVVAHADVHAIDFETTGFRPVNAKVRLTSIYGPACDCVVIDHFASKVPFDLVAEMMTGQRWAVFNAGFEGRFFDYYSPHGRVELLDVGLMSKARLGGRPLSLAQQVKRDLGIELVKDEQMSDWNAKVLTDDQITYSGNDAYVTYQLFEMWKKELQEHGLVEGFYVLNNSWRGSAAMEDLGMTLDVEYHKELISMWTKRRQAAEHCLRRFTPESMLPNLRSKKQISNLIKATLASEDLETWPLAGTGKMGQLDLSRKMLRLASYQAPYPLSRWLAALMVFNRADKYLGTYGEKLVNIMEISGAIRARFNIAQAVTGRYSSSEPNLQNIPRSPIVRRSFIAPVGATMVLADYSGIELRVLAELSDDAQLRQDVIYGDVHAENAVIQNKVDREKFFALLKAKDARAKEARSRSKAFSFQLTYGAGVGALALALRSDMDTAARHVDAWAKRYPKAYGYRTVMFEKMRMDGFLPTQTRTIYVPRADRSLPVASNYPIQGSAADVMYRAVARAEEAFYNDPSLHAKILASIHDELLSLTWCATPEEVLEVQKECMVQAWLDIFPNSDTHNLLESAIGQTWAAKP